MTIFNLKNINIHIKKENKSDRKGILPGQQIRPAEGIGQTAPLDARQVIVETLGGFADFKVVDDVGLVGPAGAGA